MTVNQSLFVLIILFDTLHIVAAVCSFDLSGVEVTKTMTFYDYLYIRLGIFL